MVVRAKKVNIRLTDWRNHKGQHSQDEVFWAVHLREKRPPTGAERLEWFLLTTYPVNSLDDALRVARGYTLRWRVEEFHKTWKSGACSIETSQLRTCENLKRWATLLAAVAARIERFKYVGRNHPDTPATEIASREEIDAAIILTKQATKQSKWEVGQQMNAGEFVLLVANLGGYTGKSSGGPPGSIVLKRGLEQVVPAAAALRAVRGN